MVAEHDLDESARSALMALVTEVERARYAPPPGVLPSGVLPGNAGRSVAVIRADLDGVLDAVARSATVSPGRRRRARWFPASGIGGWLSLWPQSRTAGTNASALGQMTDVTSPASTADRIERVGAGSAGPLDQYGSVGTE